MKASEVNGGRGETRSVLRSSYLLHAPDSFVRTPLPGLDGGLAIIHASPQLGAKFLMYTAELEAGGALHPADTQRFVWVLDGEVGVELGVERHALKPGGYAYAGDAFFTASTAAKLLVIERPWQALRGLTQPAAFASHEDQVTGVALGGDEGLMVKALLPADPAFDFAVNLMTYAPRTALAQVEVHVMEHGLLMLDGAGTYRVDEDLHEVEAGDFIWMAPYCRQWFRASADGPATYLIYKDWNRRPAL